MPRPARSPRPAPGWTSAPLDSFRTDSGRIQVFEGATAVVAAAIVSIADDRVQVRSRLTGSVQHKLVVAGVSIPTVVAAHGSSTPAPRLTKVEPAPQGYALVGSGFGTDATKLQVFEGASQIASATIVSVTNDRIVLSSRPVGRVEHKVVVAGHGARQRIVVETAKMKTGRMRFFLWMHGTEHRGHDRQRAVRARPIR